MATTCQLVLSVSIPSLDAPIPDGCSKVRSCSAGVQRFRNGQRQIHFLGLGDSAL